MESAPPAGVKLRVVTAETETAGTPSRSLADALALATVAEDTWAGDADDASHGRIFGGLLVAQALRAAHLTVPPERAAHSLHAGFVRAGIGGQPVRYAVERTHDGASFTTRRVVAAQEQGTVLVLTASFQREEVGPVYEATGDPSVPGPDGLPVGRYDSPWFESRDIPPRRPGAPRFARAAWYRLRTPLPDDPALHQHALAFLTDHGPTRAVREPHVDHVDVERRRSVSLDHAVWFHRRTPIEGWFLSELVPVATGAGRGLAFGSLRTAAGDLVASIAQEAMFRLEQGPSGSSR